MALNSFLNNLHSFRSSVLSTAKWKQLYYNQMAYRQIGLRFDDLIPEENPIVREALHRLPERERYDRLFRFRRALNLDVNGQDLAKEDWTTEEQDVPYLKPYITQIENEIATKQAFDQMTVIPTALAKRNKSS